LLGVGEDQDQEVVSEYSSEPSYNSKLNKIH